MLVKKSDSRLIYLLLSIALLLGIYMRVSVVLRADFPLNDGGLFWSMTQDLINNHFALPRFASYNLDQIPYGYAPGGFYLSAFLNVVFHISLTSIFRFMPLSFVILGFLLVYPIAVNVLNSQRMALLAIFAYASIQPSFGWLLMGGGVTRSPAYFFSMVAIYATLKAAKNKGNWRWLALSAAAMGLTALFHLEIAWVSALILVFLYLCYDRSRRFFVFLAYHLLIGALIVSPYFATIIAYHGIQPLINAFAAGHQKYDVSLALLIFPVYTAEPVFPILAVLGALGGLVCLANRQYVPVLWLLLVTLVNPRSVHRSASLPEALLIATALETFLFHKMTSLVESGKREAPPTGNRFVFFAAGLILMYPFILTNLNQLYVRVFPVLSTDERAAFAWVTTHTEPAATFLTVPPDFSWEGDWISEWFPALTARHNVLTVQGYEWISGAFDKHIATYEGLEACLNQDPVCVQNWKSSNNITYDYIFWPKRSTAFTPVQVRLLQITNGCTVAYQNTDVDIYRCTR